MIIDHFAHVAQLLQDSAGRRRHETVRLNDENSRGKVQNLRESSSAQNDTNRRSAIDARTTRHPGYAISQQKRKRVEEIFGWLKTVGGLGKLRHRGIERVEWIFTFAVAAYNVVRLRNLVPTS